MEEDQALPRYEEVQQADPWPLIVPYLSVADIKTLATVSRKLRDRAQDYLWRAPRRFWPTEDSDAFAAFRSFLKEIPKSRFRQNPADHTLSLDLSHLGRHDFDTHLPDDWLMRILSHLWNLRSLVFNHASFLDHDTVLRNVVGRHLHLRFLSVNGCTNLTPKAITTILYNVPNLYCLDLSNIKLKSKQELLFSTVNSATMLPHLQMLKLRRTGLTDDDLVWLFGGVIGKQRRAPGIGSRVWSLDVRDNNLTDDAADILSKYAFASPAYMEMPPPAYEDMERAFTRNDHIVLPSSWSCFFEPRISAKQTRQLRNFQDEAPDLMHNLEDPTFVSGLTNANNPAHSGLQNLYISGNTLTIKGLTTLLSASSLHLLDCDSVNFSVSSQAFSPRQREKQASSGPVIAELLSAAPNLYSLRVNYSILTLSASKQGRPEAKDGGPPSYESSMSEAPTTRFDPALLSIPRLTLTGVPPRDPSGLTSKLLDDYLTALAGMDRIAAEYDWYRRGANHNHEKLPEELRLARPPLATEEVTLEFSPVKPRPQRNSSTRGPPPRMGSTDSHYDADLESYAESAQGDFSFFDSDERADMAVSSPVIETFSPISPTGPRPAYSEGVVNGGRNGVTPTKTSSTTPLAQGDVVQGLSRTRGQQKPRREEVLSRGAGVDGKLWTGKMRIVRS